MRTARLRRQTLSLGSAVFLGVLPALVWSQSEPPTPAPTPDPLAGVPVQVLDQQQVTIGTHTITYNRIMPPVFPSATPTPAPRATPITKPTNRTPQAVPTRKTASRAPRTRAQKMTLSSQDDAAGDGEKPYKMLLLSATVYDHQFTEVRWPDGTEPALRAYVNIDFCYFTTVANLETADTVYDLMFAWGNDTVDSLTQAGQQYPDLSSVPAGRAGYQVFAGDPGTHPDAIAALNALCAYYDANSAQMIATYHQQQADNAARAQWLQAHPPVPPDTVINYWPARNSVFLNPAH